jgi:hypothetical protein
MAAMNLRLTESLRKKVEVEAKKNNHSLNREMVQRLERSFINQGIEAVIKQTANEVALLLTKNMLDLNANQHDHINEIAKAIGRPDLTINSKEEDSNG